eukprot:365153-Chlamydomonas_euryale.AAC.5
MRQTNPCCWFKHVSHRVTPRCRWASRRTCCLSRSRCPSGSQTATRSSATRWRPTARPGCSSELDARAGCFFCGGWRGRGAGRHRGPGERP